MTARKRRLRGEEKQTRTKNVTRKKVRPRNFASHGLVTLARPHHLAKSVRRREGRRGKRKRTGKDAMS